MGYLFEWHSALINWAIPVVDGNFNFDFVSSFISGKRAFNSFVSYYCYRNFNHFPDRNFDVFFERDKKLNGVFVDNERVKGIS